MMALLMIAFAITQFTPASPASPAAPEVVRLRAGQALKISVKDEVARLGDRAKACANATAWTLILPNADELSVVCGRAYGGIVRLRAKELTDPRAGLVVGNDWGDEGCLETTAGVLEVNRAGGLQVDLTTEYGGSQVDYGEKGCRQGERKESFLYDATTKTFRAR